MTPAYPSGKEVSMTLAQQIENTLKKSLSATMVEVIDESHLHRGHQGARAGGSHFRVTVVSDAFVGVTLLARHRMVNALFAEELKGAIHALALQTLSPSEWKQG
ncbi:MAG: BolA/IbaG family iron-sulfur metabolism protein [Polyangiales bacterium]